MRWLSLILGLTVGSMVSSLFAEAPVIAPSDNLVVDGIPSIPLDLADQVRKYTEARGATPFDWHPTQKSLLIGTRFGNSTQLHQVNLPLGARTQLTFFGEPIANATFDPAAGEFIVLSKDTGGNEFAQLYRYDVADGKITLRTDGHRRALRLWQLDLA